MKFSVDSVVFNADRIEDRSTVELRSKYLNDTVSHLKIENCFAYAPFINSHDHLIGNWYPPAHDKDLYPSAHIWVSDMKDSLSVRERDRIFMNDLPMNFMRGNGKLLSMLGCYKNIFSGVSVVHDHAPRQKKGYYDLFPIEVIRNYRQCHSLTLGNFWGDDDAVIEWLATKTKEPFVVHLGEGLDEMTQNEFARLKELGLLQPNTLIIHGISLTENEIKDCAEAGTSICWCAYSNLSLIGKTLDIDTCLKHGVNVVIGTDSTLSGSINLLHELHFVHSRFPHIPLQDIQKMISKNAAHALMLPDSFGELTEKGNMNLLLLNARSSDPLENIFKSKCDDVMLLIHKGLPIYGKREFLDHFDINDEDYYFFERDGNKRFVIGHPESIMEKIEKILGYKKTLPYLPFNFTDNDGDQHS